MNRRRDESEWIMHAPYRRDPEIHPDEPSIEPAMFWASVGALVWLAIARYFDVWPW